MDDEEMATLRSKCCYLKAGIWCHGHLELLDFVSFRLSEIGKRRSLRTAVKISDLLFQLLHICLSLYWYSVYPEI